MSYGVRGSRNIVFGLNPALQRSIVLASDLETGAVNRGNSVKIGVGGKGQDVFVAAQAMGGELPQLVQFLGSGAEGDIILKLLSEVGGGYEPLQSTTIRTASRLRNAITLLSPKTQEATEVVEPSGNVEPSDIDSLKSALSALPKGYGVACMGSMPPGCPPMLYSELVPLCCDPAGVVLLDMTSQVQSTISLIRHKCAAIILKVNIKELCAITGTLVQGGSDSSASRSGALLTAASVLASQIGQGGGGAKIMVAATDGAFAAHLLLLDPSLPGGVSRHFVYSLPPLPRPLINPIGAGDACASGLLLAISGKVEFPAHHQTQMQQKNDVAEVEEVGDAVEAFRWGLACGAASCMTEGNSVLSRQDAELLFIGIQVSSQS